MEKSRNRTDASKHEAGTKAGTARDQAPRGASGGPKFRRRAEARPDEVLDAALDLFIEKGFAATRVEDIGRRAGISKGAVYLYFPSKEALLEGLVRRAIVPVTRNAMPPGVLDTGDPKGLISLFLRTLITRLGDPKMFAIPKIVMREAVVAPQLAAMYRKEVIDAALPIVTGLIARGIREGRFRAVDPELAVRSVMGPVIAHLMLSEIFGVEPEGGLKLDRLIETHTTILFDGLCRKEVDQ